MANATEGNLPYCIESIEVSHDASSDDTRHTYAPVTITIMWLKNCTVSGVATSGSTSVPGGGLSLSDLNGYHARGSRSTFMGSVDSAYGAGSAKINFNYLNANVTY